jgi:hypothetical protein
MEEAVWRSRTTASSIFSASSATARLPDDATLRREDCRDRRFERGEVPALAVADPRGRRRRVAVASIPAAVSRIDEVLTRKTHTRDETLRVTGGPLPEISQGGVRGGVCPVGRALHQHTRKTTSQPHRGRERARASRLSPTSQPHRGRERARASRLSPTSQPHRGRERARAACEGV